VVVGPREQLGSGTVRIRDARLHRSAQRVNAVRLRYRSEARTCRLESGPGRDGRATIALAEPAEAVAPGQVACLMDDDLIVGHGTIA
jgi:tRNA-uridine 2-sulfurtransferase